MCFGSGGDLVILSVDFRAYNNKLKEIKFMMVGFAVCGYFLGISIAIIALSVSIGSFNFFT